MKRYSNLVILLSLLFFCSCATNSQIGLDSVKANNLELSLIKNENSVTSLNVLKNGKELNVKGEFLISNPMGFVKRDGKPQYYSYSKLGIDYVFIIIGDIVSDRNSDIKSICGRKIQGVVVKGDSVYLTNRILSGNITCSDYVLDEKVFFDFANCSDENK